jgi:hypothetical protein
MTRKEQKEQHTNEVIQSFYKLNSLAMRAEPVPIERDAARGHFRVSAATRIETAGL